MIGGGLCAGVFSADGVRKGFRLPGTAWLEIVESLNGVSSGEDMDDGIYAVQKVTMMEEEETTETMTDE